MRIRKKNKLRLVFCFVLSLVMFFSLIQLESSILKKQEKKVVYVAKENICKGVVITKENETAYFEKKTVPKSLVAENTADDIQKLEETIVTMPIHKNQIIQKDFFISKNSILSKIKNPIEVSIKIEHISQGVGGILREWDVVDISVVNITSNECTKVLDGAYVTKAIAANGSLIPREDISTSALTINLLIDQSQENDLNEKLASGSIRISKIDLLSKL